MALRMSRENPDRSARTFSISDGFFRRGTVLCEQSLTGAAGSWERSRSDFGNPSARIPRSEGSLLVKVDLVVALSSETDGEETPPQKSIVEAWFVKHARDVGRFLRRYVRNEHDIEECVQETFLKVWRQEQQGTLNGETQGYLYKTALNVARDRYRRNVVRYANAHEPLTDEVAEDVSPDAETSLHWSQSLRQLEVALEALRPSTRNVFLMHHVEHLTYPEIALRLGVTTRTVEREMARAVEHCAKHVQPFLEER